MGTIAGDLREVAALVRAVVLDDGEHCSKFRSGIAWNGTSCAAER